MKTHPLATAAILAMASTVAASAKQISSARHRNAFVKEMQTSHEQRRRLSKDQTPSFKTFAKDMSGDSKRARKLRKKVMEKAKPIVSSTKNEERDLQNYNQANNNGNNAYNANYANNANRNNNAANDGADDYFSVNGNWENNFGFDPTQYSLSYHRCAAVRQFDDQLAAQQDTDTVFATKNFAVFRFCPAKTCEGIREEPVEEWEGQQAYQNQQQQGQNQQGQYQQGGDYQFYFGDQNMFDNLKVGGANGEGCQSNYGEYMLELEDYLDLMTEYHNERFEMYCETCEECMYDVYKQWLNNGGRERKLKDKSDASWMDELEGDDFQKHRDLGGYDPYKVCEEYDTCRYYKNSCQQGVDETFTQYFECTEVERNNGNNAFIGPHCAADGITITLGIFADEYCNEYIGDGVNIENYLGFELMGDELAPIVTGSLIDVIPEEGIQAQKERYSQNYDAELAEYYSPVDNMCIPCMASHQPYEVRGNVYDYEDQDEDEYDDINELCENLYMVSARCDKHFRSYSSKAKQAKNAEALVQEDLTCEFIESVVMGNYDEMGFVNVENMQRYNPGAKSGMLADSMFWEQHGAAVREVSPLQIFGLIATIVACLALATWSYTLNKSLGSGAPWRPRKSLPRLDVSSPADDAISMGRSESNMKPSELSDRNRSYYAS